MRWKWIICGTLGLAGVALIVSEQWTGGQVATARSAKFLELPSGDYSPRNRKMHYITQGMTLHEVASLYSGESGVAIVLDQTALSRLGISPAARLGTNVPFVPVADALPLALRQFDPEGKLDWYDSGSCIIVSSREIVDALRRQRENRAKLTGPMRIALDQRVERMPLLHRHFVLEDVLTAMEWIGGVRIELSREVLFDGVTSASELDLQVGVGSFEEVLEAVLLSVKYPHTPATFDVSDDRIVVRPLRVKGAP